VLAEHLRRNPRLAAPLQGFVFYPDAATTYPSTNFSVSSMLSGRMARNAAEGAEHAMESPDSLLAQARRAGYGVYTTRRWSQRTDYGCVLCTELDQAERVAKRQELLRHAVNLGFGVDIEDLPVAGPRLARLGGRAAGSLGWKMDFEGLPGQLARVRAVEAGPRFYFMHFFGSHMPFTYASDCRPVPPERIAGIQTLDGAKASLDCAMGVVGAFLDKLRSEGVYDKSMVFVVSDHGYNLLLNEQANQPEAAPYFGEGTAELGHPSNFRPAGIYNPVLMFKDFDRTGPLAEDPSPASLLDVAATVCGRVSLCPPDVEGMDLRQALPGQRRRRFYMYVGGVDEHRRTADGRDKFHGGLDEFFEVRSFQGPLYPNLAEALRHGQPEARPGAVP
jgi:hypothetical protein